MPPNAPIKRSSKDKPCPTCYAPMKPVGKNDWECEKHGPPTRP